MCRYIQRESVTATLWGLGANHTGWFGAAMLRGTMAQAMVNSWAYRFHILTHISAATGTAVEIYCPKSRILAEKARPKCYIQVAFTEEYQARACLGG